MVYSLFGFFITFRLRGVILPHNFHPSVHLEIYRKFNNSSLIIERQTVYVSDDTGRIAMLEKRTYGSAVDDNDTDAELTRYIYSNHLQSASLELDEAGDIISYEEYHPYGTTSY